MLVSKGDYMIARNDQGQLVYNGDTFKIVLQRYSDPERLNSARNAAIYLGKSDRDNTRRPLSIIKQGHVIEIFRGEYAEFEFIDVDKTTYDHIITYTTRNMRVAGGNRALTSDSYTIPSDKIKNSEAVSQAIDNSMWNYKQLIELGETKQVARSAMPTSAKMNPFVYQFNFVTLMQAVFPQRIWEKGAQSNTTKVIKGMWELVHSIDSELWDIAYDTFGVPAVEWKTVRSKLNKNKITTNQLIDKLKENQLDMPLESVLRSMFGAQKSMW
ncbi:hypothetical protein C4A77_00955 [Brevibacillus laterosporus]|uniref:Uncharacterized protein n=2 Tax=Brevibacillus laterosporus TaxID=1465 RepID=A0AAP8QGW9_BRELA|nr:hypothetical protein C4A77_00955 [Brevibacillus laterosporus]